MTELWTALGQGDPGVFSRRLIWLCFTEEVSARELFYGTEARARHSRLFARAFERLEASAAQCDPDGMISEALQDSAHGRVYRLMIESRPEQTAV
jgi:hypothetical protein